MADGGELAIALGTLVGALALLLLSAERFVGASEELGLALGLPPFVMGITILAIGTSFPELVTALFAVAEGSGEMVVGTVMGSNIANILLILGTAAVVSKGFRITWDLLHGDLPLLFGSLLLLGFVIYPISAGDLIRFRDAVQADGLGTSTASASLLTWPEAWMLLLGYLLYVLYYAQRSREHREVPGTEAPTERPRLRWQPMAWIGAGLVGVYFGAEYTVTGAVQVAALAGLGTEVIAASVIAMGTSLPELVVSLTASRRGNFEMAVGNVTGSNIFNTFVVLGVPGVAAPWLGSGELLNVGEPSVLFLQAPYYAAALLLFLIIVLDRNLTRTEGAVVLLAYALFIGKLFSVV